jgi:hypothetical protein
VREGVALVAVPGNSKSCVIGCRVECWYVDRWSMKGFLVNEKLFIFDYYFVPH